MITCRFLILGAGPSGLSIAHALLDRGVPKSDLLVLESDSEAGGLCRSVRVDGAPLDIGGGHFLDVRNKNALRLLFRFLPETDWRLHKRRATLRLRGIEIDHPLESNLWQLDPATRQEFLESLSNADSRSNHPMPASFGDWVRWKFGDRMAQQYMLPYNRKIWSMDLQRLGTYWLHKLPEVSFHDTLRACSAGRPFGTLAAHSTFYYPAHFGYGEVWCRMARALEDRLLLNCPVNRIDVRRRIVNGEFKAGFLVSTIPWSRWPDMADVPEDIAQCMRRLVHSSIDVDYGPEDPPTRAHWVYEPCEDIAWHRMVVRRNYFSGGRGHWIESNVLRSGPAGSFRHRNAFAYPVNTQDKPAAMSRILDWASLQGIAAAGRWGTWEHINSDLAVAGGIQLAGRLATETPRRQETP